MRFTNSIKALMIFLYVGTFASCKKDFLDKKSNSNLVIPKTLREFQALLDFESLMNEGPVLSEVSSDDYYFSDSYWESRPITIKNAYTWEKDIYEGQTQIIDWNQPFTQIYYANIILEGLSDIAITRENRSDWEFIKGCALFHRAYAYHNLAQLFCLPYDSSRSDGDLGLPIRLKAGIDEILPRSSLQKTYEQIINDVSEAKVLLPAAVPAVFRSRPSKPAAFAFLSRIHLNLHDYNKAEAYADSCLLLYNKLVSYSQLSPTATLPFSRFHDEAIFQAKMVSTSSLTNTNCMADSSLYQSYSTDDLRRAVYFRLNSSGKPYRKGSYAGVLFLFNGLSTDELYLIKAECLARRGLTDDAMLKLNELLMTRWKAGTFVPFTAPDAPAALATILQERRKSLQSRGIRWMDLRRLNKENHNISIRRLINGVEHILAPGSRLYALPIPPDEIALSGIEQNVR